MEEEVSCPWCEKKIAPSVAVLKKEHGKVRERRCTHCGKVLAAYLVEAGDFMDRIRKFQN
jgi:uncharacterized Zn finger protein